MSTSLYVIPPGCICMGDGLMGMQCEATSHARRRKALDLFCGAGGATRGLQRAGFEVHGIDINPQPNYCGEGFTQADAVTFGTYEWFRQFDFIWASPPCQAHTRMAFSNRKKGGKLATSRVDLIGLIRDRLKATRLPYVIENVPGARMKMDNPITLSGGQFGLNLYRSRLFESNVALLSPPPCAPPPKCVGVYGNRPTPKQSTRQNGNMNGTRSILRIARSLDEAQRAMGIDWMDWLELKEAIPPGFSEYIGRQITKVVR